MDLSSQAPLLLPAAVLICWTLIMLAWLAATRVPTMRKLRMHPQKYPRTQDLGKALPPEVQWKADNYNHLLEQPTIFYATVLMLAAIGAASGLTVALAWAYVVLRIAHSLVHVTVNKVMLRFNIFGLSTLVLLVLAVSLLWALL